MASPFAFGEVMAEFPALPLFTDALIADTEHLTNEEFGAYIRLLMIIWRNANCRIPADAEWHMRRLRVNELEYKRLYEPLIKEFFKSDGNFVTQKRLIKEFEYLRSTRTKQSVRAKGRWNKEKAPSGGTAPNPTPPTETKPVDFKKVIFDEGLRWICAQGDRTPPSTRALIGKWIRDYGEAAVSGAIIAAQKASAVNPVAFIEKVLKESKNGKSIGNSARSGGQSKSERFKQALVDDTLAEIGADERRGGEEDSGKPIGRLL